jgi:hypothetical protein
MSSLANQQQNLSFPGLLQVPGGITSTLQQVQDGDGNVTGLSLSSAGASVTTSSTFQASKNGITLVGAVARLISDGFGDLPTVKDFGAVGDGTTDDTAAFTAAIAATPAGVAVPAGSYKITGTVTGAFYSFGTVTIVTGTVTSIQNVNIPYAASTGSTFVGTTTGGTGAVTRTVAAKINDIISVKDFGADSTGATDSSSAFQAALTSLQSTGGSLHIPSGSYLLNSQVVYTGKSLQIIGDGVEVTKLLVSNANGAFNLTFTTTSVTLDFLTFSNLSIIATGALNNGTALKATWPNPGLLAASPQTIIENVYIRSNVYTVNTASTPYFTNSIYLVNVANSRIQNSFISQIGNQISKGINIDNSAATSAFFLKIDGVTIEGNQYGIYQQGWIEACHLVNCEIAAPEYGIYFNNTTATALLPQITIEKLHVNAIKKCIYFNSFQDILIDGVNLLIANDARNTTATQINAVELNACQYIRISNSLFNVTASATPGAATSSNGILLTNCNAVLITANQFQVEISGAITSGNAVGVNVSTSSRVAKIVDNQFRAESGLSAKYIYVNPALYSNERVETYNNQFNDGLIGIEYKDVNNGSITNNEFYAITTSVSITGTTVPNSANLIIFDNTPRANQTLTVNSATPSVGSALNTWFAATNTTATTITNFLNGYDGQVIEIYFSNGNTTIQHNANIFTKTGSNFTGTAGDLMSLTYIYGAWRVTWTRP